MSISSRSLNGKDTSVDWPPLFVGPAKGNYKAKVLAESKSRLGERLLEAALFDRCGGKCDTWVGNEQLAADTRLGMSTIPRLLGRLESRGKWKVVDDSRLRSRRRIIDLSHPHAEAVLEALRQSPHVTFERSRSNPEAIARTKKSRGLTPSDNCHGRVSICDPRGSQFATPEGLNLRPKPLTVTEPETKTVTPFSFADAIMQARGPEPDQETGESSPPLGTVETGNGEEEVHAAVGAAIVAMIQAVPPPSQGLTAESRMMEAARTLTHGSTPYEVALVARLIAVELNDLKSLTWWKRVCQLIAVGHVPLAIFSGCSDPIVRNPAALLNSRVQKRIDIWAKHLPKFMFPGGQPKNVPAAYFQPKKVPGFK